MMCVVPSALVEALIPGAIMVTALVVWLDMEPSDST